jgi:hypothetical protein
MVQTDLANTEKLILKRTGSNENKSNKDSKIIKVEIKSIKFQG